MAKSSKKSRYFVLNQWGTFQIMQMRTPAVQPPPQHTPNPLSPTLLQTPVPDTHPTPYPQHSPNPLSPTLTQPAVPDTHPTPSLTHPTPSLTHPTPSLTHPTPSPTHTSVCTQEFDTKSRRIHSIWH